MTKIVTLLFGSNQLPVEFRDDVEHFAFVSAVATGSNELIDVRSPYDEEFVWAVRPSAVEAIIARKK